MQILLIALNAKYSHTNLAVRCLRRALLDAGFSAHIAEYTINQPLREILSELVARVGESAGESEAPYFLFSCYLWNIEQIQRLGGDLRRLYPDCRILLGGPEVSFDAEAQLSRFSFADAIFCGEGERGLPDILRANAPISGVYHAVDYVDLDTLLFPYDDLDELQNRVIYYEASRGCPFSCSYCLSGADRTVRYRSLSLVREDLQRLLDARVMQVKFVDRTFNVDAKRACDIWAFLIAQDNGATCFQMEIGGDLLTSDQLALLSTARAGLFQLEVGVQSTCEEALAASCRTADWGTLSGNIRALRASGRVHLHLDLIAGLPEEGFERFLQSFDEVFALAPHQLQLGFLKLLRGAPLYAAQTRYGLVCSEYPPYEVLSTPQLSFAELTRLKRLEEMTEIYYNSGRFDTLLGFLLGKTNSPARFLLALADRIPLQKPAKYAYYEYLYEYGASLGCDVETMSWLMRYDLCLHERPRRMPKGCAQGVVYRDRAAGALKTTLAEVFPFDPAAPNSMSGEAVIVFDHEHRDPLGHAAVAVYPTIDAKKLLRDA